MAYKGEPRQHKPPSTYVSPTHILCAYPPRERGSVHVVMFGLLLRAGERQVRWDVRVFTRLQSYFTPPSTHRNLEDNYSLGLLMLLNVVSSRVRRSCRRSRNVSVSTGSPDPRLARPLNLLLQPLTSEQSNERILTIATDVLLAFVLPNPDVICGRTRQHVKGLPTRGQHSPTRYLAGNRRFLQSIRTDRKSVV